MLKRASRNAIRNISESDRRIEYPGGGSITIRSAAGEDSLVGAGLDGIVIDETARVKQEIWTEHLRPTLTDKQGWAIFIGTPRGKNWYYDLFMRAQSQPDWACWQRPTKDNPFIKPEELVQAKSELGSQVYAQEYEAQFTDFAGQIFKRDWFEIIESIPEAKFPTVRAWDLAATRQKNNNDPDYTVGIKMCKMPDNTYVILDMIRIRETPHNVEQTIRNTALLDGKHVRIYIEEEGGASGKGLISHYERNILPEFAILPADAKGDKVTRSNPFSAKCQNGFVKLLRANWNMTLLDEIESFPQGNHDDIVDACTIAFTNLVECNFGSQSIIPQFEPRHNPLSEMRPTRPIM